MDLSQAESVADLFSSNTEASHRLAMNQKRGGVKNDINVSVKIFDPVFSNIIS